MTLKKVGESLSFLSSSHRVNPLKEFFSNCSNLWAPELSTACSLLSPSSLMPYIYRKQKKKHRKRKQLSSHIVIPIHRDAFYLMEGTWISGSCKFKSLSFLCQHYDSHHRSIGSSDHISISPLPISFNEMGQTPGSNEVSPHTFKQGQLYERRGLKK